MLIGGGLTALPIALPLREQRIAMRAQRGLQRRRLRMWQARPPEIEPAPTGGLGDRGLQVGTRLRIRARLQGDRGT